MRRASTLTSSLLSRALFTTTTTTSTSNALLLHPKLLHAAFHATPAASNATANGSKGFGYRAASLGIAGAFSSLAAASLVDEVHAKEPPPPQLIPEEVVLYQYEACPFCNKVKAFLDYYDIPYKVVEVNPLSKKEIKWSDYKKVPILVVDGEQLVDSSAIIDKMETKLHPEKNVGSDPIEDEERKWRSYTEKLTVKYAGAAAMYFVSKKLKKKYSITDERAALYDAANTWVEALDGREFLGGSRPNLADLAVFGVLRPIRYLSAGKDMVLHTRIGEWYDRMEKAVGESARIKVITIRIADVQLFLSKKV
ncbi:Glutathione S-transferase, N-terminal [Dillenia turbinata]|uniref:Prostaglandin E synthase 2 n=1 Tax=Dillenia turbinata TaxID=194707 RepID=A0AAN8UYF4_9MAGN